jgi:ADP-ribose pyrophosphatase YjhB (NUDIX family)
MTLGAQGVVIDGQGRVLLIRHGYRPGWHFPGGGIERNEAIEHGLARELLEETGVVIEGQADLFGLYTNFDFFPGDHIAVFRVEHWRRSHVPVPSREIAEQGFFTLDALPQDIAAPTRRRLDEMFRGAQRARVW